MTNYLATANLLTLCEALVTMKAVGLDLATTYEAIKISSGTSFVHETKRHLIPTALIIDLYPISFGD
jgi:3-hydroxyisobutyrate dehydrogenase